MNKQDHIFSNFSANKKDLAILSGLAVLIWFTRFLHSADFGFYADDLSNIPQVISMDLEGLFQQLVEILTSQGRRGRPLQYTLIYVLAFLGWKIGGMTGLYSIAFLVLAVNTTLFYLLLRRTSNLRMAAIGGLAYALFAADTTQTMLLHAFSLQPSITFVLIASHLLLSRRYLPAYFFSFLSLVTYETPFTVFMAVPLLLRKWDRTMIRFEGLHLLITGSLLGGSFLAKRSMGDARMADMTIMDLGKASLNQMLQGPPVSLGTYGYRVVQVAQNGDARNIAVVFIVTMVLGISFYFLFRPSVSNGTPAFSELAGFFRNREPVSGETRVVFRHLGAGAAALVLAYPLTLTVRAYAVSGRDTRVHLAAVIGAAVVVAALLEIALRSTRRVRWKNFFMVLAALEFGFLVGFGLLVQQDYRLAWQYQKDILNQVLELCPDLEEGVVILLEPSGLYDVSQIDANTWNTARVLEQVYQFPEEWRRPPRILRLTGIWERYLLTEARTFRIYGDTTIAPEHVFGEYDPSKAILLFSEENRLNRIEGEHVVWDTPVKLKPSGEDLLDRYPHGNLYDLMVHSRPQ